MNFRQFLATTSCCAMLSACDDSAGLGTDTRLVGTSSETQTALQALADSLATIKLSDRPNAAATRFTNRQMLSDDSLPKASKLYFDDPSFETPMLFADYTRPFNMSIRIDSAFAFQTRYAPIEIGPQGARQVQETQMATSMIFLHQWEVASTKDTTNLYGSGTTRSGFAFSYKSIDSTEAACYLYPRRRVRDIFRPRLYTFGQGWHVVVPGGFFGLAGDDTLPLYRGRALVGWMICNGQSATRPVWDFSKYIVHDLEGRAYPPRDIGTISPWAFDSMGLFFTQLHKNGDSSVSATYSWNLFPGTAEAMQRADLHFSVWGYWEGTSGPIGNSIELAQIPAFLSDSGHAELMIGTFVDGATTARLVTNGGTADSLSIFSSNSDHPRF